MERQPVTSSNILSIGYSASSLTLEIEFTSGAIYQYFDVSEAEHEGLMSAASHGAYLSRQIKGKYRYARV